MHPVCVTPLQTAIRQGPAGTHARILHALPPSARARPHVMPASGYNINSDGGPSSYPMSGTWRWVRWDMWQGAG